MRTSIPEVVVRSPLSFLFEPPTGRQSCQLAINPDYTNNLTAGRPAFPRTDHDPDRWTPQHRALRQPHPRHVSLKGSRSDAVPTSLLCSELRISRFGLGVRLRLIYEEC